MFAGYTRRGGPAEIVDVGDAFTDSHQFLGDASAAAKWMPQVDAFLARAGLPATLRFPDYLPPAYPPPSGFASVTDVDKFPLDSESARAAYKAWLAHPTPRVIAISPKGKVATAFGGFDPASAVLRRCLSTDANMCRLYAVDNEVVWHALPPVPPPSGFAAITDVAAVPYLDAARREIVSRFLSRPSPRALVITKTGGLYGTYGSHAFEQAWVNCTAVARGCEPYIVDDAVVWKSGLYADVVGPQFKTALRNPAQKPFQVGADHSTVMMSGARPHDEASARRLGETLLASPLVSALFENVPQGALPVIRHRASGLVCRDPRVLIYSPVANEPEFAAAPVADCITRVSGLQSDLSVTRSPPNMTQGQALAAVIARVRKEDKDVVPARSSGGDIVSLQGATTPLHISVALGQHGGWIVWERVRADAGHAAEADRLADALLKTALADMTP